MSANHPRKRVRISRPASNESSREFGSAGQLGEPDLGEINHRKIYIPSLQEIKIQAAHIKERCDKAKKENATKEQLMELQLALLKEITEGLLLNALSEKTYGRSVYSFDIRLTIGMYLAIETYQLKKIQRVMLSPKPDESLKATILAQLQQMRVSMSANDQITQLPLVLEKHMERVDLMQQVVAMA